MRKPARLTGLVLALLTACLSVTAIPAAAAHASPAVTAAPTGGSTHWVTFTNRYSGLCLDDPGQSSSQGQQMQQYDCNDTFAQEWVDTRLSNGYYTFENPQNGLCLADEGGWIGDGVPLVQASCDGSTSQEWDLVQVPGLSQTFYVASMANGWRDVSVPNWGVSNGDRL